MTRDQILEENRRLREQYGALFDATAALLFRHDPIQINYDTNTEEYHPEARTILPRLRDCCSQADVTRVVHEEFVRWFSVEDAGPLERYDQIGRELWQLWQRHKAA